MPAERSSHDDHLIRTLPPFETTGGLAVSCPSSRLLGGGQNDTLTRGQTHTLVDIDDVTSGSATPPPPGGGW